MRVRMFAVISVVIAGTIVVRAAEEPAGAPVKPQWQTVKMLSGEVVIFGNVKRAGFYAMPKDGMSLKQLVSAAGGVKEPDAAVVHLRRHSGKGEAKFIEVKAKSLARDGDIPLEANDIIEVVSPKAG